MRHETWSRSDAFLQANSEVPAELPARILPLQPYPPATQFSTALFDTAADAYVLSLQPDVMTNMLRHRRDGYLFFAYQSGRGPIDHASRLEVTTNTAGGWSTHRNVVGANAHGRQQGMQSGRSSIREAFARWTAGRARCKLSCISRSAPMPHPRRGHTD